MQGRNDLKNCGRIMVARGLTWGHSGNISTRTGPNTFLISAGGVDLGFLREEDLIPCQIDQDTCEGDITPSMETGLHRSIYQACNDAKAIIHSQPFYSTLISCSDMAIRTDILPETIAYLLNMERVPYQHAGSHELAEAVAARSQKAPVLLLESHGAVCWGASLDEALLKTEALEFLCRLLVVSQSSGIGLTKLGDDIVEDFLQHLRRIGRRD